MRRLIVTFKAKKILVKLLLMVLWITVDNASSNDGTVTYLKKMYDDRATNLLGGKYLHMRCIAHIVNLIVQDGLKNKDEHVSISRIRGAIRWNSTYLMLQSTIALKGAFDAYDEVDMYYTSELSKPPYDGVPIDDDWKRANLLLQFLSHFYKLTVFISASLHVTSNCVLAEINEVDDLLKKWLESEDDELKEMSKRMKEKFDKYWGSIDKMNMVLCYATILDPHLKWMFIKFSFDSLYGEKSESVKDIVKKGLQELFDAYKVIVESATPALSSSICLKATWDRCKLCDQFVKYKSGGKWDSVKSDLEKYLSEDIEDESDGFDILSWWKVNSPRYLILSKMAWDILAVPVSTVASESTFSTGGRILDEFKSSLTHTIVESLVCVQDWLRQDPRMNVAEDPLDVETIDQELKALALDSTPVDV